jgi:hypothetical protein
MSTAKAVIQELRQMADGRYFATHRSTLQAAAETLERVSDELAEWRATFPGKSAADAARLGRASGRQKYVADI